LEEIIAPPKGRLTVSNNHLAILDIKDNNPTRAVTLSLVLIKFRNPVHIPQQIRNNLVATRSSLAVTRSNQADIRSSQVDILEVIRSNPELTHSSHQVSNRQQVILT
jgi:hypothetical protein